MITNLRSIKGNYIWHYTASLETRCRFSRNLQCKFWPRIPFSQISPAPRKGAPVYPNAALLGAEWQCVTVCQMAFHSVH